MINRNALLLVAGAAIFALDASVASAQAKPRSTKRIPITKEGPGEKMERVDTVTVYRTDTLRMMGRVDTVMRTMTNTVTRVDTVTMNVPMVARHFGGVYLGLGGGTALPFGAIRTVNNPGVMGQVNLGYQPLNSPLGIRLDGGYTRYSDNADYDFIGPKADMLNANADLRLNLPIFNSFLGSAVRFTPYAIGGGSWLHFRELRMQLRPGFGGVGPQHAEIAGDKTGVVTPTQASINDPGWHGAWGWNAGGGLAIHAGKKELFAEARAVHFTKGDRYGTSWHVPITFGINFF
jgi:hypothetical protein